MRTLWEGKSLIDYHPLCGEHVVTHVKSPGLVLPMVNDEFPLKYAGAFSANAMTIDRAG